MKAAFENILGYITDKRGIDFSGYRSSLIERRIGQRLTTTNCADLEAYLKYLQEGETELNKLLDALTVNVTRFFRDTLTFEHIFDRVLPELVSKNRRDGRQSLRVWSVGCATGEEPYSIAIMISEVFRKEQAALKLHLFATDISVKSLQKAQEAVYSFESIKNMKFRLVRRYFSQEGDLFRLDPHIVNLVRFSFHDILDARSHAPPGSVYGSFDLVFCRNLLMYFKPSHQERMIEKLNHAIVQGGYLVLGEAEAPLGKNQERFSRVTESCRIYKKT